MCAFGRRDVLSVAALFLVALCLRLAWSEWTKPAPPVLSDAEYYDATARSLDAGVGYSVLLTPDGFRPGGDATAFYPPGYPIVLAGAYRAGGEKLETGRILNSVFGALTILPVYVLGLAWSWRRAAFVAGLIVAVAPSLIAWTPVLLSETLFTLLFTTAVALYVVGRRRADTTRWLLLVATGVAIGFAALTRGQALVLLLLLPFLGMPGTTTAERLRSFAITAACAFVVLAPWSVRSTRAIGGLTLLSTNFGYNLRVGHAPYATGRYTTPVDLWDEPAPDFRHLELVFNRTGARRALSYVVHNPGREALLAVQKTWFLWRPDTDSLTWVQTFGRTPLPSAVVGPLKGVIVVGYVGLVAVAAVGMVRVWRRRPSHPRRDGSRPYAENVALFILALVLTWTMVHILFFGEPRYHLPLLPLLAVFAAAAIGGWRDPSSAPEA